MLCGRSKLPLLCFVLAGARAMAPCYYGGNPAMGSCTQLAEDCVWMRAKGRLLCWWPLCCEPGSFCIGATPKQRNVCTSCRLWLCAEQLVSLVVDCPQFGVCFLCSVTVVLFQSDEIPPSVKGESPQDTIVPTQSDDSVTSAWDELVPGLVDGGAASVGEVRMDLLEHAQLLVSVAASIIA